MFADEGGNRLEVGVARRHEGRGFERADFFENVAGREKGDWCGRRGECDHADGAAGPLGFVDDGLGGGLAGGPVGGGGPAGIDEEQNGAVALQCCAFGCPDGAGHRQNDQGHDDEAQPEEPWRHPFRFAGFGHEVADQGERREAERVRARRGGAQQKIEHGQER